MPVALSYIMKASKLVSQSSYPPPTHASVSHLVGRLVGQSVCHSVYQLVSRSVRLSICQQNSFFLFAEVISQYWNCTESTFGTLSQSQQTLSVPPQSQASPYVLRSPAPLTTTATTTTTAT